MAPKASARKVVAFCPWVKFHTRPFEMCGVQVMGFQDADALLTPVDRATLWRANKPYGDAILSTKRTPRRWNDNPLIYVVDASDPLREPSPEAARVITSANSFLYLSAFAANSVGPGGLQEYTNAADWALYFHPVQNPRFFALGGRRLYGDSHDAGYQWTRTLISQPVECNRCELYERRLDRSLVEAVSELHRRSRALMYLSSVRTFMLGTSDDHLWGRSDDLPLIWGAVEQVQDSDALKSCEVAQQAIGEAAATLTLVPTHSTALIRAIVGSAPSTDYVWTGDFRPGWHGGDTALTKAQKAGVAFSYLERALDELNFARNKMVHEGKCPPLEWNQVTLGYLGSRFSVLLFKRILAWEGVRKWGDVDDCEVVGLQALAKHGRESLPEGHDAYSRTVKACRDQHRRERMIEGISRMLKAKDATNDGSVDPS